ncbi:UNVERIFIED_CONTAM: acyl transferase domain-containing protein [Acetivibrio alkalicellulosi]
MSKYFYPQDRIAVVSMGGLFPEASNIQELWGNILSKKVSIKDLPEQVLSKEVFYRPEVFGQVNKREKTYTKIGALIENINYEYLSKKYKIPPAVSEHMDPNQHVAIYCADQALQSIKSSVPKERTAVILGTGAPGRRYDTIIQRTYFAKIKDYLMSNSKLNSSLSGNEMEDLIDELSNECLMGKVPITEDSAPGMLQSITGARITNVFDFHGPSYTVDAACASGLAASICGVTGLLRGDYDVALVGAVEVTISETPLVVFSAMNALSPHGSFPFDSRANGFVIGLGGGILILKRFEDALRDGDNIYGLISGFGQGSDGKGKYIAAPNADGQARVIESACKMAGYSVDTIELIEAHGTGTIVGDEAEVNALKKAFSNLGVTRQNYCGIGSVKSNIGHLRYASGAPGLIKATMSLHNKILPPNANVQNINPKLNLENSPFYLLGDKKSWKEDSNHPRRVNVSSYGFGGADYHITMEEYRPEFIKKLYGFSSNNLSDNVKFSCEKDEKLHETVLFSGHTIDEIKDRYLKFIDTLNDDVSLKDNIFINNSYASSKKELRLSIVFSSKKELEQKWDIFNDFIQKRNNTDENTLQSKNIFFGKEKPIKPHEIAFMFPGQASQYPNMLKGIYDNYTCVESLCIQIDALWKAKYDYSIASAIYGQDEKLLGEKLKDTKNTHPAMFMSNMAMYKLLRESGIQADYMIGHSLGEITALCAAGMLDLKSSIDLIGQRAEAFDSVQGNDRGALMSVKENKLKTEEIIKLNGFDLSISNVNSPEQIVVGGNLDEIEKLSCYLKENKIIHTVLNVSHAFHTPLMLNAAESFYNNIKDLEFNTPKAKVMACNLMKPYPDTKEGLKDMSLILRDHILKEVNFKDSIKSLYEKGVKVFIETGPSYVLTNLTKSILDKKDVKILSSDNKTDSVQSYKKLIAELFALGIDVTCVPSNTRFKVVSKDSDTEGCKKTVPSDNKANENKESIVYSGVSVGLPGTFKKVFSDDNFELLFEGKNLIELLTDEERESILDLNITRLVKSEKEAVLKKVSTINEVIQIAGKLGNIDMLNDYKIDEKVVRQMTLDICSGIAAGYEALKDSGIPLVRDKSNKESGFSLKERFVLPEHMQQDTGIIYASNFASFEPLICEVSKYIARKYGSKTRNDLMDFYQEVISRISDNSARKILTDWFSFHYSKLKYEGHEDDIYQFNHELLINLFSLANNRLAELIGAMGPNFHMGVACSSTASSISVAEDLIRCGHASRMIVIGADAASSKKLLPWIGASFFSMGAATDSSNVFEASVPFDNRRNGMILGAGAVGIVIEKERDLNERGMNGICRILGTHLFNTASHPAKIKSDKYCTEMDRFITKMEKEHGFNRNAITKKTVYFSHDTCSPKKGGCAETEKAVLQQTFGDSFRDIKVVNTKAMTGHTMGASIEEAVAAKSLQFQRIPPIVNYKEPDPEIAGLNISHGGSYNFEYALRLVIGFGGQGNYHLLQKIAFGEERVVNEELYNRWINSITDVKKPQLKIDGRLFVVDETVNKKDSSTVEMTSATIEKSTVISQEYYEKENTSHENKEDVTQDIMEIFSVVTKYPTDMLDENMEMEADLGIDTVKQATIFSLIGEKYKIPESDINISQYKTIGSVINFVQGASSNKGKMEINITSENNKAQNANRNKYREDINDKKVVDIMETSNFHDVENEVLNVISDITKYPVEMLEKEMELEADLGIDTVKQATIFSILGDKYKISQEMIADISKCNTIGLVVDYVKRMFEKDGVQQELDTNEEGEVLVDNNENDENEEELDEIERPLSLQIPVFVEKDLLGEKEYNLSDKSIWIIGDEKKAVEKISEHVKTLSNKVENFIFVDEDGQELENRLDNFVKKDVDVIIDCTHIGQLIDIDKITKSQEDDFMFLCGEARFTFYKKLNEIITAPEIKIICALSIDGCHGYSKDEKNIADPFYGVLAGLYKGLRKEWSKSNIKIVDLGKCVQQDISNEVISVIISELELCWNDYEIGYANNYKRMVMKIDYLDAVDLVHNQIPENAHFLVTGGGYGITCEIIKALSKKYKSKFTILGRTELKKNIEHLSIQNENEVSQKKLEIKSQLEKKYKKVTPVMVQEEYDKFERAHCINDLINIIKEDGNQVLYLSCDIRNYDGLKEGLEKAVNENGPVHVLIHAAGIEKSRLIKEKSREDFKDIISVKAKGALNLYRLISKEELIAVIGFSSISGVFGNEAQIDYCAANSFISSFISVFKSKYKHIHSLSIAWSGWKDIGMAWKNEYVRMNSEELGINLIEPERGADEFIRLLSNKTCHEEIIVSKGLDFLITREMVYGCPSETIWLDWIYKKDAKIKKAFKVLSVKRDVILEHHRLGSTPIMPAVAYMEMCAQYHSLMNGANEQYCFKNVKIHNPLKLFYEKPKEIILVGNEQGNNNCLEVKIYTYLESKYGISKLIPLSTIQVDSIVSNYDYLMEIKNIEYESMDEGYTRIELEKTGEKLENCIALGALFMDEKKENNIFRRNSEGSVYSIVLPEEEINNRKYNLEKLLINPAFMDSVFQVCGVHSLTNSERVYLPCEVEEFGVVKVPRERCLYKAYSKVKKDEDEYKIYDVILLNQDEQICYYAKNIVMRRISL